MSSFVCTFTDTDLLNKSELYKWKNLDPTRPNPVQLTMELTYFYSQNLSRTFSQPSINLFMFFSDRALNALT